MPRKLTQEEFIERARQVHGDKYDYSEAIYNGFSVKVKLKCKRCGREFMALPGNLLRNHGCPECYHQKQRAPRMTQEEFLRLAKEKHGDKYDYSKTIFKGTHQPVVIICPEHGEFQQLAKSHLKHGCAKCSHEARNSFGEYNERVQESAKERFFSRLAEDFPFLDASRLEYVDSQKKVTLGCPKHGFFSIAPRNITRARGNGCGCPECKKEAFEASNKAVNEKFKSDFLSSMQTKNPHIDFTEAAYMDWRTPLRLICKSCNTVFFRRPKALRDGVKCPRCAAGRSRAEIETAEFLKSENIDFEAEKYFQDLKDAGYLRYDFYIPAKNLLVELDGQQHYSQSAFGEDGFLRRRHDEMKDEYARSRCIRLLRIPYWDFGRIPELVKEALES